MEGCIFCQIAAGEIPAQVLFEDHEALAFKDLGPQAPLHVLVIPKRHISGLAGVEETDDALVGKLVRVARDIARESLVAGNGFRLVVNSVEDAGQSVPHIHVHLLAGRRFGWPPG